MVSTAAEQVSLSFDPGPELRVVGLFAGIGGLELGLSQAGHEAQFLCELMPEARGCLEQQFEHADLFPDVTDPSFASRLPGEFDLLTAGFPCQDLSQAGKTKGIEGERSGLILRVLDVIEARPEQSRPRWLLLENVSFMRHLAGGKAMKIVLDRLTELGYSWAYREVDSQAFGLPQRRKRIYFVACKHGEGDPRGVLLTDDAERPDFPRRPAWVDEGVACGFYWTEGNRGLGWAHDAVPAIKGGSTVQIPSPPAILHPEEGLITPSIEDTEALQGFPRGWTRGAIGKGNDRGGRRRWYLVGNAVSVPVAKWLGTRFRSPQPYPRERAEQATVRQDDERWPRTAWRLGSDEPIRYGTESNWPVDDDDLEALGLERIGLLDLLNDGDPVERPRLSEGATAGFLSRFEKSTLLSTTAPELRDALIQALRHHLEQF